MLSKTVPSALGPEIFLGEVYEGPPGSGLISPLTVISYDASAPRHTTESVCVLRDRDTDWEAIGALFALSSTDTPTLATDRVPSTSNPS